MFRGQGIYLFQGANLSDVVDLVGDLGIAYYTVDVSSGEGKVPLSLPP